MGKGKKEGKKEGDFLGDGSAAGAVEQDYGYNEPRVEWFAPDTQIQLSEEDLQLPADPVILKNKASGQPSNTQKYDFARSQYVEEPPYQYQELILHFDHKGSKLHKKSAGAKAQAAFDRENSEQADEAERKNTEDDLGGDGGISSPKESKDFARNQFNFSDRAAQTFNNPKKVRGVSTKPPELRSYSDSVSQWEIYDLYVSKFLSGIKDQEIMNAAAAAKKKMNRNLANPLGDADTEEEGGSAATGANGGVDSKGGNGAPMAKKEGDLVHGADMAMSLRILERMVSQNSELEIYEDFKYWEDASDAFRDGEGSLLPLWHFSHDRVKRKQVTAICWNPSLPDLFAVGYGSYDFMRQGSGMICCYSLKNTTSPEYSFTTESGVMSLDFHPQSARCALLAVGSYDGTVMVYDVRSKINKPIYVSTIKTGKHTDPVWQVKWQEEDIAKELGFFSISTDGQVANWTMSKSSLKMEPMMALKLVGGDKDEPDEETTLSGLAGGCCFAFSELSSHLFLVGTEEGKIHKCSKAYSGQYLETYEGHHMAVYSVRFNKFHPRVFLSCSADWTVKLWDHNLPQPIMSFDLGNAVGDIAWAPYSSTVFSAVTSDGKVHVFDLSENKHEPLCEQKVVKRAKLTRVCFNPSEPIILVGHDRGGVNSLKLSPNLRKPVQEEHQLSRIEKILAASDFPQTAAVSAPQALTST